MKTVREMFVSLTAMLINHIWASIIEICVEKWRTQSLRKIEIQMSRHEKRYIDLRRCPLKWSSAQLLKCSPTPRGCTRRNRASLTGEHRRPVVRATF